MSYTNKDVMYNDNLKTILNDIIEQANNQGGLAIMGSPEIAIGTSSAAKVKTSAFTVVRDGVISTIAGAETAFTATTDDLVDGAGAVYLVYLDSANAIKILKGTATTGGTGAVCPSVPAGGLKLGEVKVVTSGAAFDASTTLLSADTVTDTYTTKTEVPIDFSDYSAKHWLHHKNLKDLLEDLADIVENSGKARLISNPNLAIGTSDAKKIKHDAFSVITDGVITTITGGEVAFTATTHDLEDGAGAVYNVYLDGSTVKILKGTATSGGTGAVCPATPAGKLKLGEVKLVTVGAVFTGNTTELSALTLTDTYANVTDVVGISDFNIANYGLEDYKYSKNFYDLLNDLEEDINRVSNDKVLGNPTLVIGSSSKKKVKSSAFNVMRDGVISVISSTETAFTATDDDLADGYGAIYNIYLAANNTITILKGTATALGTGAVCPATPSGGMKIGEVKVVADGAKFDATTDDLDADHLTVTYSNKIDVFEEIV